MPTPKELQTNADECLRLARESIEIRTKLALIEIGTELRVLALHGLLHLLGYDHETDRGRMAKMERRLRTEGGLREGLIERMPLPAPRGAIR